MEPEILLLLLSYASPNLRRSKKRAFWHNGNQPGGSHAPVEVQRDADRINPQRGRCRTARHRDLAHENSKLERLDADMALENAALNDLIEKTLKPVERREAVAHLVTASGLPVRRACQAVGLARMIHDGSSRNRPKARSS